MPIFDYSVVVACYNEADNIESLYKHLLQVFSSITGTVEFWFVDDGSTDDTFPLLRRLHEQEHNVNVLRLSRNFGQHTAIFAGLQQTHGNYIIMMDGDLQDDPSHIPKLIAEISRGPDMVTTIRRRRHEAFWRRWASDLFWKSLNCVSDRPIVAHQSFLRIFNRPVKEAILQFAEPRKFMAGIFSYIGFNQVTIEVDQGKRFKGRTKYTLRKLIAQFVDAFLGFSLSPSRGIIWSGLFCCGTSLVAVLIMGIRQLTSLALYSWGWVLVALIFSLGIQLLVLGSMAEYLGRMYRNTLKRPPFIIAEKLVSGPTDAEK
ncbi:glycosyltransferase family 2 protein [bacterium]|nr:glycosyltransferase family 2 protein [bacterium]